MLWSHIQKTLIILATCCMKLHVEAFTSQFAGRDSNSLRFPSSVILVQNDLFTPFSTTTRLYAEGDDEVQPLEKIELNDEKIAEMLEVTFIKACLQLATGYVDVLKLFLAASSAGYARGISYPQLMQLVSDCPVNTANRDLSKEEVELRSGWIGLSYLTYDTIDRLEGNAKDDNLMIPDELSSDYGSIIEKEVRQAMGMDNVDLELKPAPTDPAGAAIHAYNTKVIKLAISNTKEARLADEKVIKEDDVGPPRPNIPGAYE